MRGTLTGLPRGLAARTGAAVAVVATALSVLAGCATGGKVEVPAARVEVPVAKVETAAAKVETPTAKVDTPAAPGPAAPKGPSVARLDDGREGFVITEVPALDEVSRRDFDRAVVLLKEQDYGRAADLLEKVVERSPGVTAAHIDIAIAYQRLGRTEPAEKHLQAALTLFPGHPVACNEYGLLYRKTGRFAEARAMYEKAIERFPEFSPAHRNLGIVCDLYLNDPACALAHYEIYSKARPDDAQVTVWIADLRARLGRKEDGR